MRLIDAERFKRDISELADEAHFELNDLHFSTNDVLANIDCQLEVDAIPVKYIYRDIMLHPDCDKESVETLIKLINRYREDTKNGRQL